MATRNLSSVFQLSLVLVLSITLAGCAAKKDDYTQESAADMYDRETGGIGLGTLERVHFDYDKSSIGQSAASTLEKNSNVINGKSTMRVLVEGHCDNRGSNEYNIALGERRARSTLDYLVSLGVARHRLELKSWGEERPLDVSNNSRGHALNRRAEFVILAK